MKNLIIIIALAIFLRTILASISYHSDLRTFQYAGEVVAGGNFFGLYDHLKNLSDNEPIKNLIVFNYPPAIYLYHGIFNFIFSLFFGHELVNGYLIDPQLYFGKFFFQLHLLIVKLPYFLFDALIAFILFKYFEDKKEKLLAVTLWLFNPVNLYATYMVGQFDIIPTFFTILSIYFIAKKKLSLAAISLGFGAAFKIYPLFLLFPLIILEKSWMGRIKLGFLSVVPYLLFVLPFLNSSGFRQTALVASQTDKSFYSSIPISGNEKLFLFPIVLILVYLLMYFSNQKQEFNKKAWEWFLIPLLIFYVFTHYHPQWFLWVTPFLIIELIRNNFKHITLALTLLVTFTFSIFFFESSLTTNLLAPLIPEWNNLPGVWEILGLNIDFSFARSIVHSIFAACSLYLIFYYLPRFQKDG